MRALWRDSLGEFQLPVQRNARERGQRMKSSKAKRAYNREYMKRRHWRKVVRMYLPLLRRSA